MRSVSRLADVSINTVTKLLVDAGTACAAFHDERVRGVRAKRVQVDEIWSFTFAKAKNVLIATKPPGAGGRYVDVDRDRKRQQVDHFVASRRARCRVRHRVHE
jgi:hypothetical protein